MGLSEKLAVNLLERLPKNAISRALGAVSEVELPEPVQQVVNRSFAQLAGIDTEEGERPPEEYASLNAYFTRRLREGMRPIDTSDSSAARSAQGGMGSWSIACFQSFIAAPLWICKQCPWPAGG